MQTKITLLGKSDAAICMVMDILESLHVFPDIKIVNNLNLPIEHPFNNESFHWEVVDSLPQNNKDTALGVISPITKIKVIEALGDHHNFINLIHSTASISSTTRFGKAFVINNNSSISAHTNIGHFVNINRNCSIGHHVNIGHFVSINPGVTIAGHVTIGEKTKIGMGATILDCVTVGKNSVIGAGSLVTKDVPDNVVAYGSPCKIVRENEI